MWVDEQSLDPLYDELMAGRGRSTRRSPDRCDDAIGDETRHHLARRAVEIAKALPGDPATHAWLKRLLWPASLPPPATDPWWMTPLGLLTRAQHHPANAA